MSTSKIGLTLIPALFFALSGTTGTHAAEAAPAATPSLQFSDLGGVRTWKAGGDTVVFVKNKSDQWYKADLAETCMALDTKKGVNFLTELDPATNLKSSSVVVDHHICHVTSLTKVSGPPSTPAPGSRQ